MMRDDWVETELGRICDINMGQSPPSSTYNNENKGLPFFQGKAEFTELYPVVRKWCSKPKKTAEPNDILLSVRAPVGATNIANQKCAIGRGLAAISYPQCYKYILYYLNLIERKLDDQGTGTTFKAISGGILTSQTIPLAPLPEQRAIVAKIEKLFSDLDNGIANLNTAKAKLDIYRQAVLKKAFEGELTKDWREQRDLNGWKELMISQIGEIVTGNTPSKKNEEFYLSHDYNFYKPTDLEAGHNVFKSIDGLSLKGFENGRQAPENSILVTCIGATIGKTGLIKSRGCFNQQINAIIPSDKYNPKYVYYQAIGIDFQTQIKNRASSTTLPILNKGKFSTLRMNVCSMEEQDQIVMEIESRLSVCDKLAESIDQSLEKAEALRQSILKKAFAGQLLSEAELAACRREPDWAPAQKLLERIKKDKSGRSEKNR
jgi:type I restriction enzyme, S subunit